MKTDNQNIYNLPGYRIYNDGKKSSVYVKEKWAFVRLLLLVMFLFISVQLIYSQEQITGLTATASSYAGSYYPSKAVDGNNSTYWIPSNYNDGWIELTIPDNEYYVIQQIEIVTPMTGCTGSEDITIELRKDGVVQESIVKTLEVNISANPTTSQMINTIRIDGECWDGFVIGEIRVYRKLNSIVYTYDGNGNRVSRIITLGSGYKSDFGHNEEFTDNIGDVDVTLYPNPTQGQVKVVFTDTDDKISLSYEVYDFSGKQIIDNPSAQPENIIDLSNQPGGIYIIRIKYGNNKREWKIIKE